MFYRWSRSRPFGALPTPQHWVGKVSSVAEPVFFGWAFVNCHPSGSVSLNNYFTLFQMETEARYILCESEKRDEAS